MWLLFASSPITFTWTPKGLVASAPFNGNTTHPHIQYVSKLPHGDPLQFLPFPPPPLTPPPLFVTLGYLRAAFVPDPAMKPLLVQHWQSYPTGGRVLLDYNSDNGDDMITVQWRKKVGHNTQRKAGERGREGEEEAGGEPSRAGHAGSGSSDVALVWLCLGGLSVGPCSVCGADASMCVCVRGRVRRSC